MGIYSNEKTGSREEESDRGKEASPMGTEQIAEAFGIGSEVFEVR